MEPGPRDFILLESSVSDSVARLRVRLPPGSAHLAGHFPGQPILPAVSQLLLAIQAAHLLDGDFTLVGLTGVRFRRLLRPDEEWDVSVTRSLVDGGLRFEATTAEGVAASGVLQIARPSAR
jgi:3-hydroxyacyl-[acyl-carrier-protein] dehydratase